MAGKIRLGSEPRRNQAISLKVSVSLKFRKMLRVPFVVERGRELSGKKRRSDGSREAEPQNYEGLTRQREQIV